jgi:NADPH2:quinone reductase
MSLETGFLKKPGFLFMRHIEVRKHGGPEALELVEAPVPEPGAGEVRVALHAAGVNFIDVYYRTGLYKAELPLVPGSEGAGVVDAVGPGVTDFRPGDRVAYAMVRGAYSEFAVVPAAQLVQIPDTVDFATAAAVMLQGMTAHYLTSSTFPLSPRQTCLVHAAAGGAGGLIVQMAKYRGARAIGTVSTEAKAEQVRGLGADAVIIYSEQDFETEVMRLTTGRGVDVVYDSVGKTTFEKGLKVLRPRGMMVLFGQSSGPVPPFDPGILNTHGSLYLTRPSLGHYIAARQELQWRADEVLSLVGSGDLKVRVSHTYALSDAASAHRDLESRKTTGKLLIDTKRG